MPKVIHLIPYDGIGGVESAARSMASNDAHDFEFRVQYLFPKVKGRSGRWMTFNPLRFAVAGWLLRRQSPDVLIVSLWRSALVGTIVRLLRPQTRLVVFLHNSTNAHLADRFFTWIALKQADEIWSDSEATVAGRVPAWAGSSPITIISYLVHRPEPLAQSPIVGATPIFVFWGRLSAQKNLGRALKLFAMIHAKFNNARFMIIGPDGGERGALGIVADGLGLSGVVDFVGPLSFSEITAKAAGASFFLQTSLYEGMCLSVTEAMQLGLVPIVTPVGEVGRYCKNGVNAVVIRGDDDGVVVDAVAKLIADAGAYRDLRQAAIKTWAGRPVYRESVLTATRAVLERVRVD